MNVSRMKLESMTQVRGCWIHAHLSCLGAGARKKEAEGLRGSLDRDEAWPSGSSSEMRNHCERGKGKPALWAKCTVVQLIRMDGDLHTRS